jgi:2-dehydro-3-deoxy-D-arabinonate dehydratase
MSVMVLKTAGGALLEMDGAKRLAPALDWDTIFTHQSPLEFLMAQFEGADTLQLPDGGTEGLRAPVGNQEVWAAGVTYRRSREARMMEAEEAGGGDFYDRVYDAERPELFMKSTPHRLVGHGQAVRIRKDSKWNVPEPELTVAINSSGRPFGYTIGNDMSSRDIEGENPLYLPQAKMYDQSCALGPGMLVMDGELPATTSIRLEILREGETVFEDVTQLLQLKRSVATLAEYLFRDNSFPCGCFLMTGTGIIPPDDFTLEANDEIRITIDSLGTLINTVMA